MRVLMFGWEFPPHITGGLGTACEGLTCGLAKQGVSVTFVMPRLHGGESGESVRLIPADSVEVSLSSRKLQDYKNYLRFLSVDSFLLPYIGEESVSYQGSQSATGGLYELTHFGRGKLSFTGEYGRDLLSEVGRYALVAAELARREPHDVIHAHDWLTYLAGVAAHRVSGKPLVIHVHATEFDRSGEHVNQQVYDIERYAMHEAQKVICVSHLTRRTVIERYGVPAAKVVTVHNAVDFGGDCDLAPIRRHFPEKVVTFLGRITFQKGPDYFVEAANRVLRRMPNVRFVMAGSGDMRNRMVRRVAELGIATHFHFTGFLQGEEVGLMYRMSDVYVMPSVSEPFGITPLEAMRSQVPVIISKQSGVSEILRYALKVDFWDIDGLADKIYGLLNYPALAHFFQQHGMDEVTKLKWDQAAELVKQIYEEVIHAAHNSR